MDVLLRDLLECFRALYRVSNYDLQKAAPLVPEPEQPQIEHPSRNPFPAGCPNIVFFGDDAEDDSADRDDGYSSSEDSDDTPTPEERELAADVADYTFMLAYLAEAI